MIHLVRRSEIEIFHHPSRVISKAFDPGHEGLISGQSRSQAVIERVMNLSEDEVEVILAETISSYANRHSDLRASFRRNYLIVGKGEAPGLEDISLHRMELIGSYFTQEYSIEAAALFNPAIVIAPDQTGCPPGSLRFIMSLRAVGEGHLSSIEFRSGMLHQNDEISLDTVSPHLSTGERYEITTEWDHHFQPKETHSGKIQLPEVVPMLPPLSASIDVESSYEVSFDVTTELSERVLFPGNQTESHGLEDARLVRFIEDDGSVCYYATYTAYDGAHVTPHLLHTEDFISFSMRPMLGDAAANKGMAMFPRRINGRLWCLSRWDRESISVAYFEKSTGWSHATMVQAPEKAWDLIQMGTCSSPIETDEGWLVLTHGVGPMRTYAIGALLLDIDDPTKVIGKLDSPLLSAAETEREGYVPNVVYSCGALVHDGSVVLPYGCSDASVRFAFIDLAGLLKELKSPTSNTQPVSL
ncbi:MAG: hypothetical protein RLZZ426_266 [Actinomycetota bacterium]